MNYTIQIDKPFVFLKYKALIIVLSTVLLILIGCGDEPAGTPYADFKVSGYVRAADTQQPIPGIRFSLRDTLTAASVISDIISNASGWYLIDYTAPTTWNTWHLHAEDVDSSLNGSFRSKDTLISLVPHEQDTVDIELDRLILTDNN